MEHRIEKKMIENAESSQILKCGVGDMLKFDFSERLDHKFEDFFQWLTKNYAFHTHISNGCINGYPDIEITGLNKKNSLT